MSEPVVSLWILAGGLSGVVVGGAAVLLWFRWRLFSQRQLDLLPDGLMVLDSRERIRVYNRAALQLLRQDAGVCGRTIDTAWAYPPFPRQVLTEERSEIRLEAARHGIFEVRCVRYGRGRVLLFRDCTARHQLARQNRSDDPDESISELRRAMQYTEAADKAKGAFIAHLSHEIRSPLTGVIGFSQLIAENTTEPKLRHYANLIEETSRHLSEVLGGILDLSKIESGGLAFSNQPTDPTRIVMDVTALFQWQLSRNGVLCTIRTDPPEIPTVMLDPLRLRQIILNVFGNAVTFTREGSIRVEIAWQSGEQGGRLEIAVVDTGVGISKDQLERIFVPFFSAGHEKGGTGIGLSIARRLARESGGGYSGGEQPR